MLCAVCKRSSIYTCPRCSIRTCSVPCSTKHKARDKCTGERDKTVYVPMNQYGWGTMMNDYVYLEDVGRKVGEWGREIVRSGLNNFEGRETAITRGREQWRGRGAKTKRDVLKRQLELRDIEIDLLPTGMDRRKLNKSCWDSRFVSAHSIRRIQVLK
jgi:hypothetical protein